MYFVVCWAVSVDRYKTMSLCRQSNLCRPKSLREESSPRSDGNCPAKTKHCQGVLYSIVRVLSPVLFVMTGLTNWNEPFNWFFSNVSFCISLVMNLSRTTTAIHTLPVVPFEYNITISLPVIWFKICISIIVSSSSTSNFKYQSFKNPYRYCYNY